MCSAQQGYCVGVTLTPLELLCFLLFFFILKNICIINLLVYDIIHIKYIQLIKAKLFSNIGEGLIT